MRKFYLIGTLLLSLLSSQNSFAQQEIGVIMGATTYMGDLAGDPQLKRHFEVPELNVAVGLVRRYNLNKNFSVRGNILVGKISGSDGNTDHPGRNNRGLHFRSMIYETSVQAEWNIMEVINLTEHKQILGISTPYLFLGLGGFYFNPQAQNQGRWIDLQPLGTEGQLLKESNRSIYNRIQLNIPFGIGFKYAMSNRGSVGFELGLRKTFTDYLDDVSRNYPDIDVLKRVNPLAAQMSYQGNPELNPKGKIRGNPKGKDWYMFVGLVVTTKLQKEKQSPVKIRSKRRTR